MSHWYIPTTQEVAVEGGTFFVNACGHPTLAPRNHTENPKKASCKMCKEAFKVPRTRDTIVAKMWWQIETARQSDFLVKVQCNACDTELDVCELGSNFLFQDMRRILNFLEHCTYMHIGGAEPLVYVCSDHPSVYEMNRAMGKSAMTEHEQRWREEHALGVQESVDA